MDRLSGIKMSQNCSFDSWECNKKDEETVEMSTYKHRQFSRIYGILDLQPLSTFIVSYKSKMHIEAAKIKFN